MKHKLSYTEAVSALTHALKFGIDPSLDPITSMCEALGNPQKVYPCVQVAGTNGKSSTARFIAAFMRGQGKKVGLYTSPHLTKYPERIEIDGQVVSDRDFAEGIEMALRSAKQADIEQPTEFELLTACALWLFAREKVDWAVLEVGLGGRWDATSVVSARIAVICGIGLDHTGILGDTIEKIASEKAAIIKEGSVAVLAYNLPARQVFEARIAAVGAHRTLVDPACTASFNDALLRFPNYQKSNIATAYVAASEALRIELWSDAARKALSTLSIPGRFETLRTDPLLIIDAAHNPQSAEVLAEEIRRRFFTANASTPKNESMTNVAIERRPAPTLLIGVLADKDVRGVVNALCPLFSDIVVTASRSGRSIQARQLARIVEEQTGSKPRIAQSISEALKLLADTATIATGSITVAGEVKRLFKQLSC